MESLQPVILGANPLSTGECLFLVWAPLWDAVNLHILSSNNRVVHMERLRNGYFRAVVQEARPGCRYLYDLGGNGIKMRPDPASRFQPEGVHGPSEIVPRFEVESTDDRWRGLSLRDLIFYEIHVGTFTPEGTFDAVIPRLRHLKDLGVTAIELMPVAQFPGQRNWGYDGVFPFSVQNSYGGPSGLKRLINACHHEKLGIALDVVYNHLGPEGNYLADFGPYFTDRYRTPWGQALNFDGEYSDEVRRFFVENALYWIEEFHVDVLRLDAVHAIVDNSAKPFLRELNGAVAVREIGPKIGQINYFRSQMVIYDIERYGPQLPTQSVKFISFQSAIAMIFVPCNPRSGGDTASRRSGMTIFTTPYTRFSPGKAVATTGILVRLHRSHRA